MKKNLNINIFKEICCPSCKESLSGNYNTGIVCNCSKTKIAKGFIYNYSLFFEDISLFYFGASEWANKADSSISEIEYKMTFRHSYSKEFTEFIDNFNQLSFNDKQIFIENIQFFLNAFYRLKINQIFL